MRRFFIALVFAALLSTHVGCFIPAYSGNPTRRTQQLIFTSENLRLFLDEPLGLIHEAKLVRVPIQSRCAPRQLLPFAVAGTLSRTWGKQSVDTRCRNPR